MKKLKSFAVLAAGGAATVLLAVAPAAAESPMDIPAQTRIQDTTGTLTDTGELQSAIDRLATDHNVNLYVVTIDRFENPGNSEEWVKELAQLNNMGSNDLVLAIATEERAAYFMAGSTGLLSETQTTDIYTNDIYPELRNSDYDAAALAAARGVSSQLAGFSWGGAAVGLTVLGGVAAVAGGGAWLASRGQKRNRPGEPSVVSPSSPASQLPSIAELRGQADALLVATDDAIVNSEQEIEFARLQYGEKEVESFVQAVAGAREHMRRSFQLQKQLDDDIPDTEQEQRSWLTEIIDRCRDAQRVLAEQEKSFTDLRKLEQNAPLVLQTLREQEQQLDTLFARAESALQRLKSTYAATAFDPVADNIEQARSRREFAREAVNSAQHLMAGNRSESILEIRAGEEAVGQVRALLEAVTHTEDELVRAQESLASAILTAQRDVAQAQELAKKGGDRLSSAAAGVDAVLAQIEAESKQPLSDPLALNRRLHDVRSELDEALAGAQEIHDRERAARAHLDHALVSAQAQVSTASEYVWARRGGVRAEARTRLREAERHLSEAQQVQVSDPVTALSHANDAIRLATDAQRLARDDVDNFTGGSGGRSSDNSALLGGILLGTLLGGSRSTGFGGGHFGSGGGSFGGGFGGGSGGFGGPGAGGTF